MLRLLSVAVCVWVVLILTAMTAHAQAPVCGAATEFCAENGLSFPAGTNTGDAEPGNDYGCLSTTPNPAWFYMSTTAAGSATIALSSSAGVDIDFALWGPFTSLGDALSNCGALGSPVSCSYSPAANETVVLNSGGPGEFYLMLITNFSNMPTNISGVSSSPILGCNVCVAEGGTLSPPNQVGCISGLDPIEVDFPGNPPNPSQYGYTMVVTNASGLITGEYPFSTSLSPVLLGPGTFRICGIAYELGSGEPATFVGLNFNTLSADLSMGANAPFCGDPSANCADITIALDPVPGFVLDSVCVGAEAPDCPFINNEYICDPGGGSFITQTAAGCDSTTSYTIFPRTTVFAVDSVQICPGSVYTFNGVDYPAPSIANITVPAGAGGGCDTSLLLLVQEVDLQAVIDPPVLVLDCTTTSGVLSSTGSSSGPNITYQWIGPNGNSLGSGSTITVTQAGTYTLEVTRIDPRLQQSCTVTATASVTSVGGEAAVPTIAGPAMLCADGSGTFTASINGQNPPYTYAWSVGGSGSNVNSSVGNVINVSWSQAGSASVCVTATGVCGPTIETCQTVTINPAQQASITGSTQVCGLSSSYSSSPGGGSWQAIGANAGQVTISNPTSTNTTVSVATAGSYSIRYGTNLPCSLADTITITFGPALTATVLSSNCNATTQQYTSQIVVTGTPPYTFTGATVNPAGANYVVGPLPSGVPFTVNIVDALGCTTQVSGARSCNCTTNAGQLPASQVTACISEPIQAGPVTGQVLDGNDVGLYVLYTDPSDIAGSIVQSNTTGLFNFSPPLTPNTIYYVVYIVGNNNGSGIPNSSDPCYDVSNARNVLWTQPATANAGPDQRACGTTFQLAATGTPGQWTVPPGATVSDATNPAATLTTSGAGSYTLTWTTGTANCTDADQVVITQDPTPRATHTSVCNATATMYTLTIVASGGTAPYTINGGLGATGNGTTFTATLPAGVRYSFSVTDVNGCTSTTYARTPNCACITSAGNMANIQATACITDLLQVDAVTDEVLDPNDVGTYVLHDQSGSALGNVFATSATGSFSFAPPLLASTTYYVSFVVGDNDGAGNPDPSDPCYDVSNGQPVRWNQPPTANAGADVSVCGLSASLAATGAAGSWTVPAGVTVSSATSPTATATATAFGTYTLTWTTGTAGCTDEDDVEVTFNSSPTATAQTACDNGDTFYILTVSVAGGSGPYTVNSAASFSGTGNVFTTTLPVGTSYAYSVTDANGCSSVNYTGSANCDCETEAGTMSSTLLTACITEGIQATAVTGQFLDGDDVGTYVLHDAAGNALGNVFQTSATGSFTFTGALVAGTTYYVSFVAGNDLNGDPDPSDPCYQVSNGQPVRWNQPPAANAGADVSVCGLSAPLAATGAAGSWTVPAGVTVSSATSPTATVTATAFGTYTLTWTTGTAGCTDEDQVDVTLKSSPTATAQTACDNGDTFYTLTVSVAGGSGPYMVNSAASFAGTGNVFTTSLPVGTSYAYSVTDANGCSSVNYTGSANCDCETEAGTMSSTLLTACITEGILATAVTGPFLDGDDVGTYVLHDAAGNALGNVFQTSATGSFTFTGALVAGTTYYVSFVAGNDLNGDPDPSDPCYQVSNGQPVRWNQPPTANAGADVSVCGLSASLAATGAAGSWTVPAGVTVSSATSPTATVTATAFGTYTLTWTTGTAGCTDEDQVDVTFNSSPTATAQTACDNGDSFYTLTIDVVGGQAPYVVNGLSATGSGNQFTASQASASTYSFTITDANGCESAAVTGSRDCACETEAPLLAAGADLCAGEDVMLAMATGGVDDGDDVVEYILYTGTPTAVTQVLARNAAPSFVYDPAYTTGQTFYIAALRGNALTGGGVDEAHPCTDRSAGVPVVWRALPTITFTDASACEGDDALISYTYSGQLPASLEFSFAGNVGTLPLTQSSGSIPLSVAGTLAVVSLRENMGCTNDAVAAEARVTIQTPTPPELVASATVCNSPASGETTHLSLADLLVTGSGGMWSSPDAPAALDATHFQADGLSAGQYQLVYTTPAVGPCPAASASLMVTVRNCACPNLSLVDPGVQCNSDARIALASLLQEPQTGNWALVGTPAGSQPARIDGAFFDATAADAGNYRLLFTLTAGNVSGCPDTASLVVQVARQPQAGSSTGTLSFCESETGIVDLSTQLTSQDSGGSWTSVTAVGQPVVGSNVDLSGFAPGVYDFEYKVAAPPPCLSARATVSIEVLPLPVAEAGMDVVLTCTQREVTLGTPAIAGHTYAWTVAGRTDTLAEEALLRADVSGVYMLTVTNAATGCTASDIVEIVASDEVPIVDLELQPISCFGERDAAIIITSIVGGQAPYTILINGSDIGVERSFTNLGAGAYQVEVTDANGCTADPLNFDIIEPDPIDVLIFSSLGGASGSGKIEFQDTVWLEAAITADDSTRVVWQPAEYVACDTCPITYGVPPASLTYSVTVTNSDGCNAEDVLQVIVRKDRPVFFATGFSPNGDNVNDRFFPQAAEGVVSRVNSLLVLDRWGEVLFEHTDFAPNDPSLGWDGRFRGEMLNPQVCVFICELEFADGTTELFKGDISLIR